MCWTVAAIAIASSIDGTSVTQFPCTITRLDSALSYAGDQSDLFDLGNDEVHDTPFDCRWPLPAHP